MKKKNVKKASPEVKKPNNIKWYVVGTIALIVIAIIGVFLFTRPIVDEPKINPNITDIFTEDGEIVYYKYNSFEFSKQDGVWYTEIKQGNQPFIIPFQYGPMNVSAMEIEHRENIFSILTKPFSKVYVTFDHELNKTAYIATSSINLINNMKTVFHINVSRACLKNSTLCLGAPVITCESAPNNAVIQFIESDKTKALYEDNCLTIESSGDDFIRITEKIILDWYGIV